MMRVVLIALIFLLMEAICSAKNDSLFYQGDTLDHDFKISKKKIKEVEKEADESLMDRIQNVIGIRKSFDVASETTKPALLSFKKDDDKEAVFNIDMALTYKAFKYETWGFLPFIQFDYSSKPRDQLEKLKAGLNYYYFTFRDKANSGRIEPEIFYAKDFYSKIQQFEISLSYIPRYPDFFIPIWNITDFKFKYNGKDNKWVFGFNPAGGIVYSSSWGSLNQEIENEQIYFGYAAGDISLKRYYLMLNLYGKYELPVESKYPSYYKYDTTLIFFLDDRERSSINFRVTQEFLMSKRSRKITIGFGIKL